MGSVTQEQLEHLIRSSGAILGDKEVLVIGSQSLLPWLKKNAGRVPRQWPTVLTTSTQADIIPIDNDEGKSHLIDGVLGEESYFHERFGVYAQGVSIQTAKAPEGWQSRCYPLVNGNTNGIMGHCMHPADLFIAKAVANRQKDGPFLDAMIEYELVEKDVVLSLSTRMPSLSGAELNALRERIRGRFAKIESEVAVRSQVQGPEGR